VDSQQVVVKLPGDRPSLVRPLLLMVAALALVWPAFAAYGVWRSGTDGLAAALAAALLCGSGGAVSLMAAVTAQRAGKPVAGILGGMLIRMVVPLMALLAIPKMDSRVLASGAQEMLLGYYLVALAIETWLFVRLIPAGSAGVPKAT
jgi:hypothetical protein